MEISRSICLFFAVVCSLVIVGFSQTSGGGGGGGGAGSSLPCVQKLLPCQPFLTGSVAPSSSCCIPLNQIVADDTQCLCAVFNDPAILKSLNITQQDALNLAKSCGANADTSVCNKAAAPTSSSPTPSTPSAASNSSKASAPSKSAANGQRVSFVARLFTSFTTISSFIIVSAF